MAQLASYTRMLVGKAPDLLIAAIPTRRLFRKPIWRFQEFLDEQIEHVLVEEVDGDAIIGAGLALESAGLVSVFKSSERDLDAIAASLSRRGGAYWFFTDRHRSALENITAGTIGQEVVDKLHSTHPDFSMITLDDIARALPVYHESVKGLQANEVVLWSVG